MDVDTVFVAGASGGTGRKVLRLLGSRRPSVIAQTTSPSSREELRALGADEVIVEDLLEPDRLETALAEVGAVVSTVGSSPLDVWTADRLVDGAGVRTLLSTATDAGVETFIMESALGVGDESASPLGRLFNIAIGPVQRAKAESERAIRVAPLTHTIVRPGILTNGPRTDDVTVTRPGAGLYGAISRADVARLLVASLSTPAATDETFEVVSTPSFSDRGIEIAWELPN